MGCAFTTALVLWLVSSAISSVAQQPAPIDRQALVTRHNPVITKFDVDEPLTVGNGGFAFGADITGLQTFSEQHHMLGIPVEIQSRWCWVTDENPNKFTLADANRNFTNADGRLLGYPTQASTPAGDWLRKNPRSHPLGEIRLDYTKADGSPLVPEDIQMPEQTLDLWRGVITSKFEMEGKPVKVTTVCHPKMDVVAVRIESERVAAGKLGVTVAFPRGHDIATKNTPPLDWTKPETHESLIISHLMLPWQNQGAFLERRVGDTRYGVEIAWAGLVKI